MVAKPVDFEYAKRKFDERAQFWISQIGNYELGDYGKPSPWRVAMLAEMEPLLNEFGWTWEGFFSQWAKERRPA